jgi:putative CocE/NonD family hydrolase
LKLPRIFRLSISILLALAALVACAPVKNTPPTGPVLPPTVAGVPQTQAPPGPVRVSEFGKYDGYTPLLYYSWKRTSQYVQMRDGVRLAVDIVRPVDNGKAVDTPLPVIWTFTRYHRATYYTANFAISMVNTAPDLQLLIEHGYVIVAVDERGSGASFGRYDGFFPEVEAQDAYEITEWLAAQPWCDGNVGMFSRPALGIAPYLAASQKPPHLKAIFSQDTVFDLYNLVYPGGIYRQDLIERWGAGIRQLDTSEPTPPVDEDPDKSLLAQAVAGHQENWDMRVELPKTPYRSSDAGNVFNASNPARYLKAINQASIPIYNWTGWYDGFVSDALQWYANLTVPQKLAIGPWEHAPTGTRGWEYTRLVAFEQLRWFDYWLKGIQNGIMDELPIHYATIQDINRSLWQWHAAEGLPLVKTRPSPYFFASGPSGSVASMNDGQLTLEDPTGGAGFDSYAVDPTTTIHTATRWNSLAGYPMSYGDLAGNDSKGLTYTSPPLPQDMTVVGSPVLTLYAALSSADGDFYAYLEEVDGSGISTYVTEGWLRASHRALASPPYDNLGLPYHRSYAEDLQMVPAGQPVELTFSLLPTANVFEAGQRLRLTLTGADTDSMALFNWPPSSTMQVYRSAQYPSSITLPVMQP